MKQYGKCLKKGLKMTKHIRIENADTSVYKVRVEVWDKVLLDGVLTDVLAETINLDYPCVQIMTYITGTRYLKIREE